MFDRPGAGNRDDVGTLMEEPGNCERGGARTEVRGDRPELFGLAQIRGKIFIAEAWVPIQKSGKRSTVRCRRPVRQYPAAHG